MAITNKISPDYLPFPRCMIGYNPDDKNFYAVQVDENGKLQGITATIGEARIYVWDGAAWQKAKADSDGHLHVDIESSALPAGAATEGTLATLATEAKLELVRLLLASIDGKDFATQTTLTALLTELQAKADLTETQPISAAALPLPSGAATAENQTPMITALQLIDDLNKALISVNTDGLLVGGRDAANAPHFLATSAAGKLLAEVTTSALPSGAATEGTLATLATEAKLELVRLLLASIDGKDFATQTTLAALLTELQAKADLTETQPISAAALPLPTGAATAGKQDTMITALQLIDDLRNALDSVGADELDVNVESSVLPTGAATQTTLAALLTELQRATQRVLSVASVHEAFTATAANHLRDIFTVPAGDTIVITSLIAKDNTHTLTEINIALYNGTDWLCVSGKNAPAQYETVEAKTPIVVPAGWHVGSWFRGATIGDTLQTDLIYYTMIT